MAKKEMAKKEKESKALVPKRPAELVPRWEDIDRWFDRMAEEFWRHPFPSLFRPERWWPESLVPLRAPSIDVYEGKDEVVVKADVPGMVKEDIEVTLSGETLTIKGEKKEEKEVKEQDYRRRERSYGAFVRSVALPCEVKPEEIKASLKEGVLEIHLPKTEEAKRKAITVKID
ncbi:MAG: Hsp20/alpha crystallin family protein [Nitrospirota bacterium]